MLAPKPYLRCPFNEPRASDTTAQSALLAPPHRHTRKFRRHPPQSEPDHRTATTNFRVLLSVKSAANVSDNKTDEHHCHHVSTVAFHPWSFCGYARLPHVEDNCTLHLQIGLTTFNECILWKNDFFWTSGEPFAWTLYPQRQSVFGGFIFHIRRSAWEEFQRTQYDHREFKIELQ